MKNMKRHNLLLTLIMILAASVAFAEGSSEVIKVDHNVDPRLISINDEGAAISNVTIEIATNESIPKKNVDLVLVSDISNSMAEPYLSTAKRAMTKLISSMDSSKDKVGFVSFNISLGPIVDPTSNFTEINETIDKIKLDGKNRSGSTCLSIGLMRAIEMLDEQKDGSLKVIIFLSDGNNSTCIGSDAPCEDSGIAKDRGIIIFPIAINGSEDRINYLHCMAESTGGVYYSANLEKLDDIYNNISKDIHYIFARNITLDYRASAGININNLHFSGGILKKLEANSFQVSLGTLSINETKKLSFTIEAKEPGTFYLGIGNNSTFYGNDLARHRFIIPAKTIIVEGKEMISKKRETSTGEENYDIDPKPFPLQIQGSTITTIDPRTKISISKTITGGPIGPRISLNISVPGIDKIETRVAIALDSSGSLGKGGRPEYEDYIRNAMPDILKEIEKIMPASRVSIISWDDNVDFVYYPIDNNDTLKARMMPISTAIDDIEEDEVFNYKYLYDKLFYYKETNLTIPSSLNFIASFFLSKRLPPETYYYCKETESTNLSVGVESARIVLNNTVNIEKSAPLKMILLLVARSEYSPCNETVLEKAQNEKCDIYSIGIGVAQGSELHLELINISGDEENYGYSPGSSHFTREVSTEAIKKAIFRFSTRKVLDNIIIIDNLYPYINVNNNSVRILVNETQLDNNLFRIEQLNTTYANTLKLTFDKDFAMRPNDKINITFDSYFNLTLPIDATSSRSIIDYRPDQIASDSFASYRWLGNDNIYAIPLPESPVHIYGGGA
jgi:Mg-chelatase subunit ChlD